MPTTLTAGDIAFVEFNTDGAKSFAFVLLRDVEAGTVINFTDNGWTMENAFRSGEGVQTWTADADVAAGEVIRLAGVSGGFNLSSSGDQILAYQGEVAAPVFLAALQFNGADWDATASNSNSSALPMGLTDGANAVSIANVDNGVFSGATVGDLSTLRAALNDAASWTTSDSAIQTFGSQFRFVEAGDAPVYTITADSDQVLEGDTGPGNMVTYTVTRAGDASAEGSVAVALTGSATEGEDYTVDGLVDGRLTFAADETTKSFTITTVPDTDTELNETVVATISDAQSGASAPFGEVFGAPATATIQNDEIVAISAVQGTPETQTDDGFGVASGSPLRGQTVTVEAIVVGDFQDGDADGGRNLGGFYLQEELVDQDGNPLSSEGIFISQNGLPTDVSVGDRVRVTGVVQENFGQTQILASGITVEEANAVADVSTLAVDVDLSAIGATTQNQNGAFQPDLEAFEGMLIRLPNTMTINEQFQLDRFNEIKLFDANGFEQVGANGDTIVGERPFQFTQYNAPDAAAYETYLKQVGARTVTYDDGLNTQNNPIDNLFPNYGTATAPRMGDTIEGLTGVLDYQWAGNATSGATWRVRAIEDGANAFERGNGNPAPDTITADGTGLKVASFNVLNFFTTLTGTIDNGQAVRGANNPVEYERQLDKLVVAIDALDADVVGLLEIENDFDLAGNAPAVATLVAALNEAAGGDVWAYADPGTPTIGGDAIAVAAIYRTDTVRIADGVGANGKAIALLTDADPAAQAVINDPASGTSAIFSAAGGNRVPLAVTFEEIASGEEITVAVNHFKSKGSAANAVGDADAGDGAGASNQSRVNAATALDKWLDNNPTGSATTNKVILGDLNSYASEEPIAHLLGEGWVNLAAEFLDNPYGYVFDGFVGTLDYILASGEMFDDVASLVDKIEDFAIGNINADEADALDYNTDFGRDATYFDGSSPVRASDHDPLVASFNLGAAQQPGAYTLQILHFSDAEASTLAPETAPLLAALVDAFEEDYANTLILSGGDNFIAGPFLSAGADPALNAVIGETGGGRPDIEILNRIGVEASALGNHEFDFGPGFLDNAISQSGDWQGALFPYVTANVDFAGTALADNFTDTFAGSSLPLASSLAPGSIVPATVIEEGGERIGIIGATTQILERIAQTGGVEIEGFPKTGEPGDGTTEVDDMQALADYLQPFIDTMRADGINKIILTSHLQDIANEQELATLLDGVDVILAAGSNTRLGDANDVPRSGESFQGTYPIEVTDAGGGTTLIVNTDGQYKYLGRLAIEFNANGNVLTDSYDPAVSGSYASTQENVAAAWNTTVDNLDDTAFADGTKGAAVREVTNAVQDAIDRVNGEVIGYTNVALNGERNPGVRSEETNLGNLSADANIAATRSAFEAAGSNAPFVVAIKNGGGIRAGINAGEITLGEANAALAFDNRLMVFDATPQELLNILEFAADFPNNNGGFPQVGGLRYSYNEVQSPGANVVNVALIGEDGSVTRLVENGQIAAGAPSTIQVSVLNFTAQGGDGYPIKENGSNFRFVFNDGTLSEVVPESANFTDPSTLPDQSFLERSQGEQQAFADYIRANFGTPQTAYNVADTAEGADTRIQNLTVRNGVDDVFDGSQPPVEPPAPPVTPPVTPPITVTPNPDGSNSIVLTEPQMADQLAQFATPGIDNVSSPFSVTLPDGIENVTLTGSADINATGNNGANAITGNAGNNVLMGDAPPAAANLSALGLDSAFAMSSDTISLGGSDTITAGEGNDVVFGNQGADILFGNQGADRLYGGKDNDFIYAGKDDDYVEGNLGDDYVEGNLGNDIVNGNQGNDTVLGNQGNDTVHGGQGDDLVHGGQGDDLVFGDKGNDRIWGDLGNDTLTGGEGADTFFFALNSGNDVITDFRRDEGDRLDFQGQSFTVADMNGSAVFTLSGGGTIVLNGVSPATLDGLLIA